MKLLFKKQPIRASPSLKLKLKETGPRHLDVWEQGFSSGAAKEGAQHDCAPLLRPQECPEMPDDISSVGADELGSLFGKFSAWSAFLEEAVAKWDITASEREAYLEHIQAEVRLTKSGTVQDKNAKALNSEKYIKYEMLAAEAVATAKLLKARLRGYDKCAAALSREISRRSEGRG